MSVYARRSSSELQLAKETANSILSALRAGDTLNGVVRPSLAHQS